jgi:ribosomal subunit interface protein
MQIIIKTKDIELTAYLQSVIDKKIGALIKFIQIENAGIFVELKKETNHHKQGNIFIAEAIVTFPGKKLVAKAHGQDIMEAIGKMKSELGKEMQKYKTKRIEKPRRQQRKLKEELL